jgi:hypothetical protein
MRTLRSAADLPTVDDDEQRQRRAQEIQRRLEALGIGDREFHRATGIDRKTLNRAVQANPSTRPSTYAAIEAGLTKLEEHMTPPMPPPTEGGPGTVTFKLTGNFGVDVVVQGPVENLDELEASVEKLLRGMRNPSTDDQ